VSAAIDRLLAEVDPHASQREVLARAGEAVQSAIEALDECLRESR